MIEEGEYYCVSCVSIEGDKGGVVCGGSGGSVLEVVAVTCDGGGLVGAEHSILIIVDFARDAKGSDGHLTGVIPDVIGFDLQIGGELILTE